MTGASPRILPFGDGALLVVLGERATIPLARRARALAAAVEDLRRSGAPFAAPVPAAASVLVPFDPLDLDAAHGAALVEPLLAGLPPDPGPEPGSRLVAVPVAYGGEDGPDLEAVAAELGMRPAAVAERHAATEYEVLFLGFTPGFPYLGEVPPDLVVPRLATPRTRVPAGSVGVAGRLTGIYPQVSPGGWRILGRTDLRLFDPGADPPTALRPGDRVRFVPS